MKNRLSKLIHKDGHCFYLPIDHGYFLGPTKCLERMLLAPAPLLMIPRSVSPVMTAAALWGPSRGNLQVCPRGHIDIPAAVLSRDRGDAPELPRLQDPAREPQPAHERCRGRRGRVPSIYKGRRRSLSGRRRRALASIRSQNWSGSASRWPALPCRGFSPRRVPCPGPRSGAVRGTRGLSASAARPRRRARPDADATGAAAGDDRQAAHGGGRRLCRGRTPGGSSSARRSSRWEWDRPSSGLASFGRVVGVSSSRPRCAGLDSGSRYTDTPATHSYDSAKLSFGRVGQRSATHRKCRRWWVVPLR